jgi:hypothetical protein
MFHVLRKHISAPVALSFCLAMSLTPFVQGSSIYLGYPDAAGWLIVALAMLNPHPFLWAMAPVLIQLNDR